MLNEEFYPLKMLETTEFEKDLNKVLTQVRDLLVFKNQKYGDSALRPLNCFSKLSPEEGINLRIDDKLKRIQNQSTDEDAELDLVGYLILKRILLLREKAK